MEKVEPARWREAVPPGLRALKRWVGHQRKRPLKLPTWEPASVIDEASWGTFEEAASFYEDTRAQPACGSGFVFTRGDGLLYVDLDHVLSSADPPRLTADGEELLKLSGLAGASKETYVEVSPSGTGLHVVGVGRLPPGPRPRARVGEATAEWYDSGRYTTVTGRVVGCGRLGDLQARAAVAASAPSGVERAPSKAQPERAEEVAAELATLDPDLPYEEWLRVGMALKAGLGDAGLDLWVAWSAEGRKHKPGEPEEKWRSFSREGVGLGSLLRASRDRRAPSPEDFPLVEEAPRAPEPKPRRGRFQPLSKVEPARYEWAWEGRAAFGYITLVVGDPEVGKSIMWMDLAARASSGRALPGQAARAPEAVLLLNAEDGSDDVVLGRLKAAGANLDLVHVLDVLGPGQVQLPDDVGEVEEYARRVGARHLVLDPLDTTLPLKVDSHRSQHVRGALLPLWQVAKRLRLSVNVVVHMNKKTGDDLPAMQRIMGSVGLPAAARSTMFVVREDPADKDGPRLVVQDKASHARHGGIPTLRFRVASAQDPFFPERSVAVVEWLDDAAEPVDASRALSSRQRAKAQEVEAWLRERLRSGPAPSAQLDEERRALGYGRDQVYAASVRLRVKKTKEAFAGQWLWQLERFEEGE